MAECSKLKNAPITEAIIDIRIKLKDDFDIKLFQNIHDSISEQYPNKKLRYKWEGKLELKKGDSPVSTATEKVDGCLFTSADGKQVLQTRIDGFTFNRLKPYDSWNTFRDEAIRLWKIYKELISPEIIRVALRYINKFDIPLPIKDFNEYLTAGPIVPEELPQGVNSYLSRIVISKPELNSSAIITQAFEQIVKPNLLPIILDIDVFKQKSEVISEIEAFQTLEQLRDFKNGIFFASITEKTKEIFL